MQTRSALAMAWVLLLLPMVQAAAHPQTDRPAGESEPQDRPGRAGRSFLWGEINLVGFYSAESDRIGSTPRPQRSSVGLEYAGTLGDRHPIANLFGGHLKNLRFDLHPLVIYDPLDNETELVFHDAWILFELEGRRASKIKVGHFLVPFGQNPVLEPRGFFLLPLTAADLGFKRDWGVSFQSRLGQKSYEVALTAGSGLGLHLSDDSWLLTTRIGTPTYKDLQFGISALYGNVPEIRAEEILSNEALSRWRLSGDALYKLGTYTVLKGEVAAGRDEGAPAAGYKLEGDYIVPSQQNLEAKLQLTSWYNDLDRSSSDDTTLILGLSYSLNTVTTLSAYYLKDLHRFTGEEDDRFFLQIYMYFRSDFWRRR